MNQVADNLWAVTSKPDKDTRLDWATPFSLFNPLHAEFGFDVDVCATAENAKLPTFWSPEDDAFKQDWGNKTLFMNPPYGREISKWLGRALNAAKFENSTVVAFIYTRTDTAWWHDFAMKADEIRLIRGRTTAEGADGPAPAPHCVVIWRPGSRRKVPKFLPINKWGVPLVR